MLDLVRLLLIVTLLPWDAPEVVGPLQSGVGPSVPPTASAAVQPVPPLPPAPPAAVPQPVPQLPQIARPAPPRAPGRLTPFVVTFTGFDSNINHDAANLDSYGGALGVGGIFRNDPRKPAVEVQYQAGLHRQSATNQWNRLSHYVRAAWDRRLSKRFELVTVGEVSIKGSTEDRELSNQFVLSPRLEFRITRAFRVRALGAWRAKRYQDDPGRNASNRYGGLALVGRPRSGVRWDAGGRYEVNDTKSDRYMYYRWTWFGGLSTPLTARDRLEFAMRYSRQRYPYRLVDIHGGPDVPRRDRRVDPDISWLHSVQDVDLRIGYGFSGRDSNDPRRDYRSHEVLLSVLRRW